MEKIVGDGSKPDSVSTNVFNYAPLRLALCVGPRFIVPLETSGFLVHDVGFDTGDRDKIPSFLTRDVSFLLSVEAIYLVIRRVPTASYASQPQPRSCHILIVSGLSSLSSDEPAGTSTPSPRLGIWMKTILTLAGTNASS